MARQFNSNVDVRTFGAQGDGINDDGPAFQAAINALAEFSGYKGAAVGIPPGVYLIRTRVRMPRTDIGFQGVGDSSIVICGADPAPGAYSAFIVPDATTAYFTDMHLKGPAIALGTVYAVEKQGTTGDVIFENVTAENVSNAGVYMTAGCRLVMDDCSEVGNDYATIHTANPLYNIGDGLWGGANSTQPRQIKGILDPSAAAGVTAPEGSFYQRYAAGAGEMWLKTGAAATGWAKIVTGSGATVDLQTAYTNGAAGASQVIQVSAANGGVLIEDSNPTLASSLFSVTNHAQTSFWLDIDTTGNVTTDGTLILYGGVMNVVNGFPNTTKGRASLVGTAFQLASLNAYSMTLTSNTGDVLVSASGLSISAGAATAYIDMSDDNSAALSGANHGRLIYDSGTQTFQVSLNGAAYASLATGSGGVTLDGAYNFGGAGVGRAITVNSGSVTMTDNAADNNDVLAITKSPAGAQTGAGVSVTMGSTVTGAGVSITHPGGGTGLAITKSVGAGSSSAMTISLNSSSASAKALNISLGSTGGVGLVITDAGGSQTAAMVQLVRSQAASTGECINITKAPGSATAGNLITLANGANSTGTAIGVTQSGNGTALTIAMDSDTTAKAMAVSDSVACTTTMVALTRATTGSTGVMLALSKAPGGATAGNLMTIAAGANTSGHSLAITQSGSGTGITILMDSTTTARGISISDTAACTNTMVTLTRATTDATGIMLSLDKSPGGLTSGNLVSITAGANALGNSLAVTQSGSGTALAVSLNSTTTARGITISDSAACTNPMVTLTRNTDAATGVVLSITKSPGSSTSGTLVSVTAGANATGDGIAISQSGSGAALSIAGGALNLTAGSITTFIDSADSNTALASAANHGRIRYNSGTQTFQVSLNTAAYVDLATSSSAGVTLTGAYNFGGAGVGRTITAISGAVVVTTTAADNNNVLEVTKNPVGTQSGIGVSVTMGSTTTGSGVSVAQSGTGAALAVTSGVSVASLTQSVATTGSPTAVTLTLGAHTTLAASTEAVDVNFNAARTVQFAQGALTTQRAFLFQAPTYAFATGSSTLTNAATVAITGAPAAGTNATLTNRYGLLINSTGVADTNLGVISTQAQTAAHVIVTNNTAAANGALLSLSRAPTSGTTTGHCVDITLGAAGGVTATTSGNAVNITVVGAAGSTNSSHGVNVSMPAVSSGNGLNVTTTAASTGAGAKLTGAGTGPALWVSNGPSSGANSITVDMTNSSANGIDITQASTNAGTYCIRTTVSPSSGTSTTKTLQIVVGGGAGTVSGNVIDITATKYTGVMLNLSKSPGSSLGGNGIALTMSSNCSGHGMIITYSGTGTAGIIVDNSNISAGGSSAVPIAINGAGGINYSKWTSHTATTSNNTTGNGFTLTTNSNTGVKIRAQVLARRSGGNFALFDIEGAWDNNAGTVALVGAVQSLIAAQTSGTGSTLTCTFDISGTDVRLRVTGNTAETWTWEQTIWFQQTG